MMKKQSLTKNFIFSSFYQLLIIVIPLITTPYVSRVLGAERIGIYSFTLSNQTYFTLLASLGTLSYGAREISRNRDSKEDRSKIFWEIEILTVITSGICLVFWIGFIFLVPRYKIYYIILSMNFISTMMDISWFYTGIERFEHIVFQNSIFKILGLILVFLLVKREEDLLIYIAIMSGATLGGNLTMWLYLPRYVGKVNIKGLRIIRHLKETLIYFVPTIATSVYTVLDKTLIGIISNDIDENGYYEQATKISALMKSITFTSMNAVMGTRISYLFTSNKDQEIKERISFSMEYIILIGIGLTFGVCAIATEFVPLFFGKGYDKVVPLLYYMSPLTLIVGISNCLGSLYYTPSGKRSQSAKFIIIGSVENLCLNLVLIPRLGAVGAIIATIIAESTISWLYIHYSCGYYNWKSIIMCLWKKLIAGCIMFVLILCIKNKMEVSLVTLFVEIIVGIAAYFILLIILKDKFLIHAINTILGRLTKKA